MVIAEVAHKPLVCTPVHSFVPPPALTTRHILPRPFGHPEGQGSIAAARPVSVPAVSTSGANIQHIGVNPLSPTVHILPICQDIVDFGDSYVWCRLLNDCV